MIPATHSIVPWLVWVAVLLVSELTDAMFSGLETGIYVMNKNRLDLHAEAGNARAKFIQQLLRRPNSLLAVLLIGTNVSRYLATFAISAMFVLAGYGDRAGWYTIAIATPLLFVTGDSGPKIIFQRLGTEIVYRLSWLLKVSRVVFLATGILPLVLALSAVLMRLTGVAGKKSALGHEGVAAVVAEGRGSGVLTHFQSVMADRVMHIEDVTVGDVMVPMRRVVSAPLNADRDQLVEIIRVYNYSRLPLRQPSGQVEGILNVYDLLVATEPTSAAQIMTAPLVLPAETTVTRALYQMRRSRQAMAVISRNTKHVGIITIKDLVEEIVGELEAW